MDLVVIIIYSTVSALILLYSISQLSLLYHYFSSNRHPGRAELLNLEIPDETPMVTIQLPLYNEMYVVERLLNNIAKIEYPPGKLEIQVLDDSTDDSVMKTERLVKKIRERGLDIQHIRRHHRDGFKAGALKEGLSLAKGELIAVFDADFLPGKAWLHQTVPHFKDPEIGVVQTRWGHLNRDYSLLTKILAFALDFHFIVEQTGRNFGKHFMNFNGTAGIWRKQCIIDAGNWAGDTLTEDLDLSYRAQLKKWKFKYLEEVVTPAELPVAISAARSQQFRWNKGAAENFQKNFFKVLRDKKQTTATKIHAFFHLLNSSMFVMLLFLAVFSVPVLYIQHYNPSFHGYLSLMGVFAISLLIFLVCYWVTYSRVHGKSLQSFFRFLGLFIAFFSIAMGLSAHNAIAVIEGHFGKKSDFIRTPKFNINNPAESWKDNIYLPKNLSLHIIAETLLLIYFCFGIYSAIVLQNYAMLLFHGMLVAGFGYVVVKSLNSKG